MAALGTQAERDAVRTWREPGDWEDATGTLHDAVSGRAKEVYDPESGALWPIYDMRQVAEFGTSTRQAKLERALSACFSGKYAALASCTFDGLYADWDPQVVSACRRWAAEFDNPERTQEPRSLILSGPSGSGKTYMAAAVANELVRAGKSGICTSVRTIEDMAGQRFGAMSSVMDRICSRDFIVLDDFGSERGGSWSADQIFAVLDHFYQLKVRLVVTTNLTENQIARPSNPQSAKLVGRIRDQARLLVVSNPDRNQLVM